MTRPRVVLADDSALFREGLAALLTIAGVDVVAQTDAAEEIEQLVGTHRPDVLVTDVRMPPRQVDEGLQAARLVRRRHPGVGVVILSQHVDVEHALDILADRQGGVGYLLKDHVANIDELRDAIERVMARDFVFDRDVVAELVQQRRLSRVVAELSPREREVLALRAGRMPRSLASSGSRPAPWRSTSGASSGSSICRTRPTTTAASLRSCATSRRVVFSARMLESERGVRGAPPDARVSRAPLPD
jgi:DNA-binding NarL/FixJ family response regulator